MEINIDKRRHISKEKKKTVWNFQDKEGWEEFRSMTKADKNLISTYGNSSLVTYVSVIHMVTRVVS